MSWNFSERVGSLEDSYIFLNNLKNSIDDIDILRQAFYSSLFINKWELSRVLAQKIVVIEPSNFFANLVLSTDAFTKKDYDLAEKLFNEISSSEIDKNYLGVILSWLKFSRGKVDDALGFYEDIDSKCIPLNCLHKALINNLIGKNDESKKNFDILSSKKIESYRLMELLLNFYINTNDLISAKKIYDLMRKNDFSIIDFKQLKKNTTNFDKIDNYSDGLAEAYFNIAGWFFENNLYRFSGYFAIIGLHIRPDFSALKHLLANVYNKLELHSLVLILMKDIDKTKLYYLKDIKIKLRSLSDLGENKLIIDEMEKVVEDIPDRNDLKTILADSLRITGKYEQSLRYYNSMIEKKKDYNFEDWNLFYSRGIAYERLKKWKRSEADLLKAIELNPNSAYVKNYLAYSWLERKINLNKALKLIKKAIEIEPNDAFIIDSLGWAYFLLGNYDDATKVLEKALNILPFDATINNHLGDAYWKVGRKKEALSQWKKVLVYDPKFEYRKKVMKKISFGL